MSNQPTIDKITDHSQLPDELLNQVKNSRINRMRKFSWTDHNQQLVIVVIEIGNNPANFRAIGASSLIDREDWQFRSPVTKQEPIAAQDSMLLQFSTTLPE